MMVRRKFHVENHACEHFLRVFASLSESQSVCEQSQAAQPEQNNGKNEGDKKILVLFTLSNMYVC